MKRLINYFLGLFEKRLYKVLTETNQLLWVKAWNEKEVRGKMYQLVGSENFTIKRV